MRQYVLVAGLLAGCSFHVPGVEVEAREEGIRHPGGMMQRAQARGPMQPQALVAAKLQRDLMAANDQVDSVQWTWIGPGNIGGRIRAICIDPQNSQRMWIGSAGGGVWRTTNAGSQWQPCNDMVAMLGTGCMVLDPANNNHLYLGTGEGFFDAPAGSNNTAILRGAGIFESFDGGTTWTQIPSTATANWHFVNRLAFAPGAPATMLAATASGIWRSLDAGVTWTQQTTTRTLDIDFHPTDPLRAVAGRADGVAQYSTDGGVTWNNAVGPLLSTRVELAYAPSNPNLVYCTASDSAGVIRVWLSGNGGVQYTQRSAPTITTYSLYNNCLWVDPFDSNVLIYGGVQIYRSLDGGNTRSQISSGAHPDYQVVVHHPGYNGSTNRIVYTGDDGGIHRMTDARTSTSWTALNNNLGITQFYGAAVSPNGRVIAGAQDNGTNLYTGSVNGWTYNVIGGDGSFTAADVTNSNYLYGQYQYLGLNRSSNGGNSFSSITSGLSDPGPNFMAYILLDPNDQNRLIACGRALWRNNNARGTPQWTQIKPSRGCTSLVGDPWNAHFASNPSCNISTCAIAAGDANVIWVGHNDGEVYRTANGTAATPTWTRLDTNGIGLPDRWISSIAIDPNAHSHVVVSLMGYTADNLYETFDNGATWQPCHGTGAGALPAIPVSWVLMHQRTPALRFAGTDLGLFCSSDAGASWVPIGGGPANVCIDQLVWKDDRTILVVTHGQGCWYAELPLATIAPVGAGCAGGTVPVLMANPPILGYTQNWAMAYAAPNATVWLAFSLGAPVPSGQPPCVVQVDINAMVLLYGGPASAAGTWAYPVVLPSDPNLVGVDAVVQCLVFRLGGPFQGIGDLSNAQSMTLGF